MNIKYIGKDKAKLTVDYYVGAERRRRSKTVSIDGKKDAQRKWQEFQNEVERKKHFDERLTVSELCKAYISHLETVGIKATTIKGYNVCVKRIISAFGGIFAKDLTPLSIEKFISANRKYSPKTIKNTISLLSSAYKYAIRKEELEKNPCELVTIPKQEKPEIKTLSMEEIERFCECLESELLDFKVLCELALFCGMRRSEILGITNNNVNLNFATIKIEKSRHIVDGKDIIQTPKTTKSYRTVALPEFIVSDIQELLESHDSDCEFLIQYCNEPMKHGFAEDRMRRLCKKYGFDITIHGLRHTFVSMLLNSGSFDLAEISEAVGHSNLTTTLNIYSHVLDGAMHSQKRIADSFSKKFGSNSAPLQVAEN